MYNILVGFIVAVVVLLTAQTSSARRLATLLNTNSCELASPLLTPSRPLHVRGYVVRPDSHLRSLAIPLILPFSRYVLAIRYFTDVFTPPDK